MKFCFIGGDSRNIELAKILAKDEMLVYTYGLEKGFVEKQYPLADPGLGTQLYKDGLYVRVTNSLMAGIRFLVEIPQA